MFAGHFSNATARGDNTHSGANACHRGDCGILGNGTTGSHSSGDVGVFGGSIHVGGLLEAAPPIRHALELKPFAHRYYYCRASATTNEACFRWSAICCDGYASAGRSTDTGSNAPYCGGANPHAGFVARRRSAYRGQATAEAAQRASP